MLLLMVVMSGGRMGWGWGTILTKYNFVTILQAHAHVQQMVLDLMAAVYDEHIIADGCNDWWEVGVGLGGGTPLTKYNLELFGKVICVCKADSA